MHVPIIKGHHLIYFSAENGLIMRLLSQEEQVVKAQNPVEDKTIYSCKKQHQCWQERSANAKLLTKFDWYILISILVLINPYSC